MLINVRDLNTVTSTVPLIDEDTKLPFGQLVVSHRVQRYIDVRNGASVDSFVVRSALRLVIPTATFSMSSEAVTAYDDYPAVLQCQLGLTAPGATVTALGLAPRTVNSAVNTSTSSGSGNDTTTTREHASGSSTSQTNGFSVSGSDGWFVDGPTEDITGGFSHSTTTETSQSDSAGLQQGSQANTGAGQEMTVKDWSCSSQVDKATLGTDASVVRWIWGQEYPWDVRKYPSQVPTTSATADAGEPPADTPSPPIPAFVAALLYDATMVYPPSDLSQFGLDLRMTASFLVEVPAGQAPGSVSLQPAVDYFTASHSQNSAQVNAVQTAQPSAVAVDLLTYGLAPLPASPVAVGFSPSSLLVAPIPAAPAGPAVAPFLAVSADNSLCVADVTAYVAPPSQTSGFSQWGNTLLGVCSRQDVPTLTLKIQFKVVDLERDVSLFLKHWTTEGSGFLLTITINGTAIEKYVTELESQGGEANLLGISLRDLDYGSSDFHDYLVPGLNEVLVSISQVDGAEEGLSYALRAVAVE